MLEASLGGTGSNLVDKGRFMVRIAGGNGAVPARDHGLVCVIRVVRQEGLRRTGEGHRGKAGCQAR